MKDTGKTKGQLLKEIAQLKAKIAGNEKSGSDDKQVKDALQLSEKFNRSITQTAADAIISINSNGIILSWNNSAERIFGYSSSEMLNKSLSLIIPDRYYESHKAGLMRLKKGGEEKIIGKTVELSACRKDGTEFPIELSLSSWTTNNNNYYTGIIRDITERQLSEEALRTSEEKFRKAIYDAPFPIMIHMEGGKVDTVNDQWQEVTGYSHEEISTLDVWTEKAYGINKKENKKRIEKLYSIDKKEDEGEYIITTKSGEKRNLFFSSTSLGKTSEGKNIIISMASDLTDYKQAVEKVKNSKEKLGSMIQQSPSIIELYDLDGLQIQVNKAYEDLWGFPASTTVGKFNVLNSKEVESTGLMEYVKKAYAGEIVDVPEYEFNPTGLTEARGKGRNRWLRTRIYPLKDTLGSVKNIVITHEDITIQKSAELKLINALEKATESDRLKSAFLATMSHELRTPLNAIIGFSSIINNKLSINKIINYGKIINTSGNHLLNIVEDLFDISLIESGEIKIKKENVELQSILNDVHEIIKIEQQKLNKDNIALNLIVPPEVIGIVVNTDRSKLKQILINLLKNALKFTHEGHVVYGFIVETIQDKPRLKFYVEDTGIGIAKDNQKFIFEVFRKVNDTYTKVYGGTGIGLSISKKLTELLGGKIWIESKEGKGSTFYFTIALDKVEEITKPVNKVNRTNNLENKTILIVEDVEISYELLKILLDKLDINTLWAENGEVAVQLCKDNASIDLVLMDINMPVMNGYVATRAIKEFRSDLPIIAQTSYANAGDMEKSLEAGCDNYLTKPIKKEKLFEMINMVFAE